VRLGHEIHPCNPSPPNTPFASERPSKNWKINVGSACRDVHS
jgi:hypothetical protein